MLVLGDKQNTEASSDDADDLSEDENFSDEYSSFISSDTVDSQETKAQNDKSQTHKEIYHIRSFAKNERKIFIVPKNENNDDGDGQLGQHPRRVQMPSMMIMNVRQATAVTKMMMRWTLGNGPKSECREAMQIINDTGDMSKENQ